MAIDADIHNVVAHEVIDLGHDRTSLATPNITDEISARFRCHNPTVDTCEQLQLFRGFAGVESPCQNGSIHVRYDRETHQDARRSKDSEETRRRSERSGSSRMSGRLRTAYSPARLRCPRSAHSTAGSWAGGGAAYFQFRSTLGPRGNAEGWFDQKLRQA